MTNHYILQDDLNKLEAWARDCGMSFNATKCNVMSIRPKSSKFYELDDTILKSASSTPYLGVEISDDLKWSTHVNNISKKANSKLGFVRRNLKNCSTENKKTAYMALVRSVLEYGSAVWDPHTQTDINRLERVQRCSVRFITGDYKSRNEGCVTEMLRNQGLPELHQRRTEKRLCMMYQIVNNKLPAIPAECSASSKAQSYSASPIRGLHLSKRSLYFRTE